MRSQTLKKYARATLACISFAIAALIGLSVYNRQHVRERLVGDNPTPKVAAELTGTEVHLYGESDKCINPDTELELTDDDLNADAIALVKTKGAAAKEWITPSGTALRTGANIVIDDILVNKLGMHKTRMYSKGTFCADRLAVKLDKLLNVPTR